MDPKAEASNPMTGAHSIRVSVVTPTVSEVFPHQVGHLTNSPRGQYLVAFSPDAHVVSVLSAKRERREVHLPQPTACLCMAVDLNGSLLAFANSEDDRLHVRHLDSNQQDTIQHRSEVVDAQFDGRGRLWTVCRGKERFVVALRSPGSWDEIATAEVGDPYFLLGGAELRPGPTDDAKFVGVYSGQSEQENFLCQTEHSSLVARHITAMGGEQFVFPSPYGPTTVTLDHETCAVASFRSPFDAPVAVMPWPGFVEDACEDERPGYYGCHIDGNHFLAGSSEGRLFLFQLGPFQVAKEIQVSGHTPVAASVKYPSLSDVCGLVSDLLVFGRCGDCVVAFFAENHRSPSPQLVVLPIAELVDRKLR